MDRIQGFEPTGEGDGMNLQIALRDNSTLECLQLGNIPGTPAVEDAICSLLNENKNIKSFRLPEGNFTESGVIQVLKALCKNKNIQTFELWCCPLGDSAVTAICDLLLKKGGTLQNLQLRRCSLSAAVADDICAFIKKNNVLKVLRLREPTFKGRLMSILAQAFSKNKRMSHFCILRSTLTNAVVPEMVSFLQNNKTLESLQLESSTFTDDGFIQLLKALTANTKIESFNVLRSELTDQSVSAMCKFIEVNTTLKHLQINQSNFTDAGFTELLEALIKNVKMIQLCLLESELTDQVVPDLCRFLKKNKTLQVLCLGDCNFTDNGVQKILDVVDSTNLHHLNVYTGKNSHLTSMLSHIEANPNAIKATLENKHGRVCLEIRNGRDIQQFQIPDSRLTTDVPDGERIPKKCQAGRVKRKIPKASAVRGSEDVEDGEEDQDNDRECDKFMAAQALPDDNDLPASQLTDPSNEGLDDDQPSSFVFDHHSGGQPMETLNPEYKWIGLERLRQTLKNDGAIVYVAVVDTGIDTEHPDLKDITIESKSFVDQEPNSDTNNHGTMVAGILWQYAPFVRIINLKVIGSDGIGDLKNMKRALSYIEEWDRKNPDKTIDIINLSIATEGNNDSVEDMLTTFALKKVVVCVASNEGQRKTNSILFPGTIGNVLTIGSCDELGNRSDHSGIGQELDFLFPGCKIISTCSNFNQSLQGSRYHEDKGTSFAAPHCSALAAVLLAGIEAHLAGFKNKPGSHWRKLFTRTSRVKLLLREACHKQHSTEKGFGMPELHRIDIDFIKKFLQITNDTCQ